MSDATKPAETAKSPEGALTARPKHELPNRILLIPYPKIVFLYPTMLMALVAGVIMNFCGASLEASNTTAVVVSVIFLAVFSVNLVILGFDFPRTTSLTAFFLIVAVALGLTLLFVQKPDWLPAIEHILTQYRPLANATLYWSIAAVLGVITLVAIFYARFDCWEARPNELLHHHGLWGNLERFSAPGLRIDKEINDVFEYLLLRSGRLILHPSNERRSIILDNIPFIKRKEETITRMLSALQVEVRDEDDTHGVTG
jgi:hypothetical protein